MNKSITTKSKVSVRLNEDDGFTFEVCSPEVMEIFKKGYWTRFASRHRDVVSRFGQETVDAVKEIHDQVEAEKELDFYSKDSYPGVLGLGFFSHLITEMFEHVYIKTGKCHLNFGLHVDQFQDNNWLINHTNKTLNYILLFDSALDQGIVDTYTGIQSLKSLKRAVYDYSRVISAMIKSCQPVDKAKEDEAKRLKENQLLQVLESVSPVNTYVTTTEHYGYHNDREDETF